MKRSHIIIGGVAALTLAAGGGYWAARPTTVPAQPTAPLLPVARIIRPSRRSSRRYPPPVNGHCFPHQPAPPPPATTH